MFHIVLIPFYLTFSLLSVVDTTHPFWQMIKNGRNIDVREVQLYVNTYATSEFRVDLINETGSIVSTRYISVAGAQRTTVSVKFPYSKARYLSCRVTPRSLDGTTEAPSMERMRIGFGINNLVG